MPTFMRNTADNILREDLGVSEVNNSLPLKIENRNGQLVSVTIKMAGGGGDSLP